MNLASFTLWILPALPLQEFEEVEFHRVHLRNGNFIDGRLVTRTDRDVTLRVRIGEITLRNDLIERAPDGSLRIEIVRIRGIKEAPPPAVPAPPATSTSPKPLPAPPLPVTPTPAAEPAPPPSRLPEPIPMEEGLRGQILGILRRLASAEESQRSEILQELIPLGEPAALYLASNFEEFPPGLRGLVAEALGQMNSFKIIPLMKKLLKSPDLSVRAQAASILGNAGAAADAPDLHPLLRDPEPLVRAAAVTALGRLRNPASLRPLIGTCADPEEIVRSRAIDVLPEFCRATEQESALLPALQEALERSRGPARADLIRAAARTESKEAWPVLEPYLSDEDPAVRSRTVEAVLSLQAQEASPALLARLEAEEDEEIRQQLAFAAEKFNIRRAVPRLIQWLQGEEERGSRQAAYRALRKLTLQNFPPDHSVWADWWERVKPE